MARAFDLHGKVAVITGAGSGIGRSTAMLLARNGAKIHAADIDVDRARKVVGEIDGAGGSAHAHALDVSDAAAVIAHMADATAMQPAPGGGTELRMSFRLGRSRVDAEVSHGRPQRGDSAPA